MSFRDPATGRLEGFDVDIAREIARDLLGDPEKIEYRILTVGRSDRRTPGIDGRRGRQDHDHHVRAAREGRLLDAVLLR